ncbi:hypothetical protein NEUTE1DRAFT_142174 [Neurospora tetrasperma FGSC 2508]|uniref:Uncharacterized protein n=1 Tax=Neurospora tetrasperma (strain FGSC 2508 / ATCC MYA-4615 / P0657) TaxID=510951 RepID=F8N190_NEUT8|nr:uncharacterized protein NEUTE1DRAFT_142174 [Neurospora tetrasperma FGSC 2508]EGO52274.1 hypothetical protein NEUTE1DRAFT_142174 [Neurospora tetrasperma FGSC 2508]
MASNDNRKKTFNKKKGKHTYNNKYGWTPEADAAVEAFFAEPPKKEGKEQMDDSESAPYQAADHETPRAKMENPLPFGNKGLAGSRFAVEEDIKLLPPGEKGLANSRFATPETAEKSSKA